MDYFMLRTFDVYNCYRVGKEICLPLRQEQDAEFFQKLYISSIILLKRGMKNVFREGLSICHHRLDKA